MDLRPPWKREGAAAMAALLDAAALTAIRPCPATAKSVTTTPARRIVQQYQGVQATPAANLPNGQTTDAPLLSSGGIGGAVGGIARYSRSES